MSGYWVYENWPNNHATLHVASCKFCNDGRGIHKEDSKRN